MAIAQINSFSSIYRYYIYVCIIIYLDIINLEVKLCENGSVLCKREEAQICAHIIICDKRIKLFLYKKRENVTIRKNDIDNH